MKINRSDLQESDLPIALGKPAQRALTEAGYRQLAQLAEVSEAQLMQLHGIGPKAFTQLRSALRAKGLSFAAGERSK